MPTASTVIIAWQQELLLLTAHTTTARLKRNAKTPGLALHKAKGSCKLLSLPNCPRSQPAARAPSGEEAGKIYGSCSSPPWNSALESSTCWSHTVTRGKEREVWVSCAQRTLTCLLSFWRTFSLQITLISAPLNNTYSIPYKTAPFAYMLYLQHR